MSFPSNTIVSLEEIMVRLLALLAPLADAESPHYQGFKIVTRKFKTPDQVGLKTQTPGLFILQGPIDSVREGGKPAIQTVNVNLFIYTNPGEGTADDNKCASTILNNCITSVNARITDPTFPMKEQTLGGLVSHCWTEGATIYDSGEVQPPGLAVIPVKILVPAIAI